jgi:hypothetical protein
VGEKAALFRHDSNPELNCLAIVAIWALGPAVNESGMSSESSDDV